MIRFQRTHGRVPQSTRRLTPQDALSGVEQFGGSSSVVEHNLAKVGVAGSNPVFRSTSPETAPNVHQAVKTMYAHAAAKFNLDMARSGSHTLRLSGLDPESRGAGPRPSRGNAASVTGSHRQ